MQLPGGPNEEDILPQADMSFMDIDDNADGSNSNMKWPNKRGNRKAKEL